MDGSIKKPNKQLKAFKKVYLQPVGGKYIEFKLSKEQKLI